jgi:trehalose synthase
MPDGLGGLLVDSVQECATAMLKLLNDRDLAEQLGQTGRQHVREHFLLPRMLMEELRLLVTLDRTARSTPSERSQDRPDTVTRA